MSIPVKDTRSIAPKNVRDFNARPSKWDKMLGDAFLGTNLGSHSRRRKDGGIEVKLDGHEDPFIFPQHITRKSIYTTVMSELGLGTP